MLFYHPNWLINLYYANNTLDLIGYGVNGVLWFAGSKEETFFDSQGWLDSDSEDDFVSVNGGIFQWLNQN